MANWTKWLWGGFGWAMFGPIGGIMGFALGSMSENVQGFQENSQNYHGNRHTQAGDFGAAMLILFAAVMKADNELKKTELEFVKKFFIQQFNIQYAQDRMRLFREILKQDLPLKDVCSQIKQFMDHPSRLQMIHILFGLSQADGHIHPLGVSNKDFESIKAMFYRNSTTAYKILEISKNVNDNEVKKAYRKMAVKFHPDKVHHLGEEFQKMAEEKFKTLNDAYSQIKKQRGFK
jgi:DnaJ like chaperone protein